MVDARPKGHHFRQASQLDTSLVGRQLQQLSNLQHFNLNHSPNSHHQRSPREDVNVKLKAMNLMSKSSNCSVLEVIEPPSTAGSDNENSGNTSGNGMQECDHQNEPEYENAVAAVVQNAPEGIVVDPMGRIPPPPPALVPPPPVRVTSKATAVDQVIAEQALKMEQLRQQQAAEHQARMMHMQGLTHSGVQHHQRLIMGNGDVVGTVLLENHYQSVASTPTPTPSVHSAKIRNLVDR